MRFFILFFTLFSLLSQDIEARLAHSDRRCFATLDWTVAETLIALNHPPCAVGDALGYQKWVAEPKLPMVVDLGIRNQPNQEQIATLATALDVDRVVFINSDFYQSVTPLLEKFGSIAAVEMVNFYQSGDAWQNVLHATQQVADLIGKPQSAVQLFENYSNTLTALQPQAQPFTTQPIALVQFIDTRHLRIYGKNSPFGAVLQQLGFTNAWQGEVNSWGFDTITITQLANLPENTRLVVVKPYPSNVAASLQQNTLWHALPLSRNSLILPAIWTFGGIPSAQRFAESLVYGLKNGGEAW